MALNAPTTNTSRRILAVDDDAAIRRLVQANLQKQGFSVMMASNGLEALQIIQDQPPDLVVLDIEMPEMDGFEVLRVIRRTARTARLPVIMLTGRDEESAIHEGWMTGADVYLTKPVRPPLLMQAIQDIFDTIEGSKDRVIGLPARASGTPLPVPGTVSQPVAPGGNLGRKLLSWWPNRATTRVGERTTADEPS